MNPFRWQVRLAARAFLLAPARLRARSCFRLAVGLPAGRRQVSGGDQGAVVRNVMVVGSTVSGPAG